jgi:hypothetical protein
MTHTYTLFFKYEVDGALDVKDSFKDVFIFLLWQ